MKGQPVGGRVDTLGHRIRWARQHNTDLGRHQFARALGINVFRAKAIEDGKEPIIPKNLLATIAKTVKSSPEWLKYGTEKERFFAVKEVLPRIDPQDHSEGSAAMTDDPALPAAAATVNPTVETVWPAVPAPAPTVLNKAASEFKPTPPRPARALPIMTPEKPQKLLFPHPTLAGRVREAREAAGMTLSMLANATAMSIQHLQRLENGEEFSTPRPLILARALKVGVEYLLIVCLAGRVRRRRADLKLSRETLAEEVGVRLRAIEAVEFGQSQNPIYLPQLARALDVNETWLKTGEGPMERKAGEKPAVAPTEPAADVEPPIVVVEPVPTPPVEPVPAEMVKEPEPEPPPAAADKEWTGETIAAERHRQRLTQTELVARLPADKQFAISELSKLENNHPVSDRVHRGAIEALTDTKPLPKARVPVPRKVAIPKDEIAVTPEIGARVREARIAMAMSANELGRRVDRSAWYVAQLERANDVAHTDLLPKIAAVLGTTLDHLLHGPVPALSASEMGRSDRPIVLAPAPEIKPVLEVGPEKDLVAEPGPPERLDPVEFFKAAVEPVSTPVLEPAVPVATSPVPTKTIIPVTEFDMQMDDGEFHLLYRQRRHHLTTKGEFGGEPELLHVSAVTMSPRLAKQQYAMLGMAIELYEKEMGEIALPVDITRWALPRRG